MFCRLCLHKSETENFTEIFVTTSHLKWQDLIAQHLDLMIKQNDAHSRAICQTCTSKLKEFQEFYDLVQNRQMLLSEIEANVQASAKPTATKASSFGKATSKIECAAIKIKTEGTETTHSPELPSTTHDEVETILVNKNVKAETFYENVMDFTEISLSDNGLPNASDRNLRTETGDEDEAQRTCVVCQKILISSLALKTHINDVHMKPFAPQSGALKRKRETMDQDHFRHMPTTTTIANKYAALHRSDSCDETANRTCILCNKTFKRMSTLLAHMKRFHAGVHPYECSECGVKFLTHRGLGCHFETSKDCAKANQKFIINSNLQELNFAKQLDKANAAYRTCDVCKTLCENWKHLEKHMLTKHDGIRNFLCKTCGQTFLLKLHFHNHLKSTPTCV